jgi:PAS domain S-box-containing protein
MDRILDRSVLAGLGLLVALLLASAALSYHHMQRLYQDAAGVATSQEELDLTGHTLRSLLDAETGVRGFVITGREEYLQPYDEAVQRLDGEIAGLRERAKQDPVKQRRIERLREMAAERLARFDQAITRRRQGEPQAPPGKGKAQMDAIRALIAEMEREEHGLLRDRQGQTRQAYVVGQASAVLAAAVGLCLVGAFYALLRRSLAARQEAAALIDQQREWLRTTLASIGDAVIATDTEGRVTFMNPVAQGLTGWHEDEAQGRALEVVFRIADEDNGQAIQGLPVPLLKDGAVVGLPRHAQLTARDGTAYPIDDSAAPIRDRRGRVLGVVVVFRDVRERRRAEAALRESERRLRERGDELETVLRTTPVAIWISHDPQCRHITGNPASYRLLNLPPGAEASATASADEVARRPFREFRNGRPVPPHELPMQLAAATGEEVHKTELTLVFRDGGVRHIYGHAAPLRNPDGSVRGAVAALVDITELREAQAALQKADRRKDEFLATLNHELRTALAPIRNGLQLLRVAGPPDPQLRHVVDVLGREVTHLVRLVDDLLDVSRITRGKIELRKKRLDVAAVAQDAVELSRPAIEAGKHHLAVTLPPAPLRVVGDPTRLAQVIANLLNNSAKYTPEGGHIGLVVERAGDRVVIRVRDDGEGIPAAMLPKVFDMFAQVDRAVDRSQGGLGIGLTLVRRLVEMHGGTVEAASEGEGKGSEFTVRLPVAEPAPEPQPPTAPPASAAPPTPRRILVVDDNRTAADILAMLLRWSGHDVQVAYDGRSALEMAAAFGPEVVVLDLGMPGMTGFEVARQLRKMPELHGVILVAQTGWGQPEDRLRTAEAGFDAHLLKPLSLEELEDVLATVRRA